MICPKADRESVRDGRNTFQPKISSMFLFYPENCWSTSYRIFAILALKSLSDCNYPLLQKLFSTWLSTQTTSNPLIN